MRRILAVCATVALAGSLLPGFSAAATTSTGTVGGGAPTDVRHVGPDYNKGRRLPLSGNVRRVAREARSRLQGAQAAPPVVGDDRTWLALDDAQDTIYLKDYRLRGVGDKVEVWVAHDVDKVSRNVKFQPNDCRNGERTTITDDQVNYLIDEFDTNMYPKESQVFSVPPARDGANAVLPELVDLPADYYAGEGDNIVVLIDNVRDDNFYDYNNTEGNTYIAGFFYSIFNELVDRNVMSIDAYDWLHRTGANPPNDPSSDNCTNAPARPFLYESVFAHEYQHLLEYYEDPDETTWVNEGLSDWAQTLTGYVDPSVPITDQDFDSHVQCFLGYLGIETPANPIPRRGGPENSLTAWQDQGADEILCDYGATYTMMEYLHGLYGDDFMTALHTGDRNGLKSLRAKLAAEDGVTAAEVIHRWAAMVVLDGILDDGATLNGASEADYKAPTLDATINWDETHAYSKKGAPPNGSDYVRLRDAEDTYLEASQINEIAFDGASALAPLPIEWRVDKKPPQHDSKALYSGSGTNFDRTIVRRVYVRKNKPTVSFKTKWNTEEGWDFGFVQVSTDGGKTYKSLKNADTTSVTDPGAIPIVKQNVPGFTGNSGGWKKETFNLEKYAGQSILLSFRYVTDSGVDLPGWWIDDIKMGGKLISRGLSLAEWQSATQVRPKKVKGFTVQLVAYNDAHGQAWISEVPLDEAFAGTLDAAAVNDAVGGQAQTVAAIVTYDEPTELISPTQYARYSLTVNGVEQPGG
ncbi:MAG: immune inhibitor A [Actinomycetota bacterium]|nr:immune inhibitor A [Actinomycetota bacterium]